ncbi:TetR/AcrR family transcriptional regulator [Bacillus cereus]|uniref:TetR/AcrR family transcriptional regulator n=1 Tax=Bacillus cereus TaxID=1396 RepID=A0AA44Q8A0_BACCE|nr:MULTISPECIES: TetR/AcrR family transcriptional regulator [Bacillus cereus group]EEL50575.1 Transcriptional regulator (TetR family) [Bacillus cereus Rock3-44]PFA22730.1 TetR/AcrR family transcriptional regulator [Bacillus cereus]PFN03485.1 TetR/AcrR family transcriptional regulator [Bacillus cereus]PFO79806.1 TetR/AcrR family transcriptional regulator [Bacillus cereus]PFR98224.1 TetR/AcrR family transcriptional regulator [Bacillus cereus]
MDGFQRRREKKKINILEAALTLFTEYGVQKISIAEIAKKANVSQVTIYNYFESKHNLTHEVFMYSVNQAFEEFEQILNSDVPFPEKIKQLIFMKKEAVKHMHQDFYENLMKEYTSSSNYLQELYVKEALPRFVSLFNEGKEQGYVDPSLSNEAILFYMQAINEYIQRKDVYQNILPLTEDIMNILFYGIIGKEKTE